jgi:hypothetical protein
MVAAMAEAALAGGVTAAQQPFVQKWRAELGLPSGFGVAAAEVGIAAGAGGVLGGGLRAIAKGLSLLSDRQLAQAADELVPDKIKTPEQKIAIEQMKRDAETADSNPFPPTEEGTIAHTEHMVHALNGKDPAFPTLRTGVPVTNGVRNANGDGIQISQQFANFFQQEAPQKLARFMEVRNLLKTEKRKTTGDTIAELEKVGELLHDALELELIPTFDILGLPGGRVLSDATGDTGKAIEEIRGAFDDASYSELAKYRDDIGLDFGLRNAEKLNEAAFTSHLVNGLEKSMNDFNKLDASVTKRSKASDAPDDQLVKDTATLHEMEESLLSQFRIAGTPSGRTVNSFDDIKKSFDEASPQQLRNWRQGLDIELTPEQHIDALTSSLRKDRLAQAILELDKKSARDLGFSGEAADTIDDFIRILPENIRGELKESITLKSGQDVGGSYSAAESLIDVSLSRVSRRKLRGVVRHESIHALRDSGVLSKKHWDAFLQASKDLGWMKLFKVRERWGEYYEQIYTGPTLTRIVSEYVRDGVETMRSRGFSGHDLDAIGKYIKRNPDTFMQGDKLEGLSQKLMDNALREESIAEAYRLFHTKQLRDAGRASDGMQFIEKIIDAWDAAHKKGGTYDLFDSYSEALFERIERGQLEGQGGAARDVSLATLKNQKTARFPDEGPTAGEIDDALRAQAMLGETSARRFFAEDFIGPTKEIDNRRAPAIEEVRAMEALGDPLSRESLEALDEMETQVQERISSGDDFLVQEDAFVNGQPTVVGRRATEIIDDLNKDRTFMEDLETICSVQ